MESGSHQRLYEELCKIYTFSEAERDNLKSIFTPSRQRKGDIFVSEGEIPDVMAFVVSGLYKYYYIDHKGNERIKHFTRENDFISSYASFIMRKPSLYYIEAVEDSELLLLRYPDYIKGIETTGSMQTIARVYTERMYIIKELREGSFLKETAQERYAGFVQANPDLVKRVTQKNIASYLGITPESMSRIKRSGSPSGDSY